MADVEELHFEWTNLHRIASLHRVEHSFACTTVVARQFDLDQAAGQASCVHRSGDVVQNMVNSPNMVFMSMRNYDPHYLIGFLTQIFIIGNDVINPEHIVFGKHDACIYNQNLVVEFVGGHILAHFPKPPQGNNLQFSVLTHTSIFILTSLKNIFIRQWRLRSYEVPHKMLIRDLLSPWNCLQKG